MTPDCTLSEKQKSFPLNNPNTACYAHFYISNNYINIDLGLIDVYMEKSVGKLFVLNDYPCFVMTLITTLVVDNYS